MACCTRVRWNLSLFWLSFLVVGLEKSGLEKVGEFVAFLGLFIAIPFILGIVVFAVREIRKP